MSEQLPNDLARGPIAWMAANPIAANLAMILLLAGGVWTGINIQKEVFPAFQLDIVEIDVGYPGAAPAEVEQGILLPIEEAVRGVSGIKEITSNAREGRGRVSVELVLGTDRMRAFQDIDQAVNRIRTFPDDIDQPEVRLQIRQTEVMEIGLFGEVDVWTLRKLGERLRDQLQSNPAITQVELGRAPDYVTHVEISQDRLREYGMTLGDVADVLRSSSEDIPAGAIETRSGEVLIRLKERKEWAREFGEIEVLSSGDGATVLLSDIAEIRDGFEEIGFHSQFNQTPSIEVQVYRIGKQSPLDIAAAVQDELDAFRETIPPGVQIRIDGNAARDFRERLMLLLENAMLAVAIVLGVLALFLKLRLAFWVMMGMTISFVGAVLFLPPADISVNMVSMFAFLVVLGIVVDDAIVVGENVHEHLEQGKEGLRAAVEGTREVAAPVTYSILTNIVAFVPLLFIPGETGKFWWPLPAVVIVVLLVSLFEALYILPAHLAHVPAKGRSLNPVEWVVRPVQWGVSRCFQAFVDWVYAPFLKVCLHLRYITISLLIAVLIVVLGYSTSDHMGMIMMPEVSADEIEAGVRLPVGTTPDQAARVAHDVTAATRRMFDEHDLYQVAEGIKTNVRRGNFIDVEIVMRPPTERERDMNAADVIALWRDEIGDLPGVDRITFEAERGPGGHRPDIAIDLSHTDPEVLARASKVLLAKVEEFTTTLDVSDSYRKGKTQFDFSLRPEGRALGLTAVDVGQQVRDGFFGALAVRQLRGTNEFEVRVKLPEDERKQMYALESFVLRSRDGMEVPLTDVVDVVTGEAFTSIDRRDGRRVITVSCDVEPERAIGQVITALEEETLPELRRQFPAITWSFQGSQAEMRESTQALGGYFLLALGVMYALLAIAFKSYFQPLIVLIAIPFGIIGAVIGHILLGYDLSLVSLMGLVALSGVVVNDSLIMVDFANRRRRTTSVFEAIHYAGVRRFRPIMLTTLTTFGGLTPIILEKSTQAQNLIPMAISLGFGIVFATAIILLLVPCLYLMLEDFAKLKASGAS